MLRVVSSIVRFKVVLLVALAMAPAACQAGSAPSGEPLQWTVENAEWRALPGTLVLVGLPVRTPTSSPRRFTKAPLDSARALQQAVVGRFWWIL